MTPLEIEQWVLLASDVASPKHWEATAALQAWSADASSSHDVAGTLLAVIQSTQHEQVLFYALTTFPRGSQNSAFEQRTALRQFLLHSAALAATPSHLRTKAGVVLAHLIRTDFFHQWTTAFDDLRQQASPDLCCRTLQALMEDFDTVDPEDAASLKDAMRGYPTAGTNGQTMTAAASITTTNSISARLVDTLIAHATQHRNQDDASLLILVLTVLKKFASWIDMSLLLQNRVLSLVFCSLSSSNSLLGVAAMEFLQELVGRGMHGDRKLALLQETDLLRKIHEHVNLETLDASPIEVVIEVAKLMDATGQELAPLLEENGVSSSSLQTLLWPQLMELFFRCFAYDDIDVSAAVIPLASRLTALRKEHLPASQLLTIMYRQMRYPADYHFDYQDDEEAEEEVYREELRKLFQRLVRACPDLCLQFLCEALANLPVPLSGSATPDVEAALRLVYHYCEGIRPPPGMKAVMKNDTFRSVLIALHQSDITDHPHREVLILYYDISVRYYPIFLDQPELLPKVLQALSGECGLQHVHARVRSRSCYLLLRLVKAVVRVMRPYVETAVTGIQGLLSNSNGYQQLRPDDALYLFETIGLLLGKTGLAPTEQQNSLTQVIAPHIRSIEETLRSEELQRDPEYFAEVLAGSVAAIAYLSKGFSKAPVEVQAVLAETVGITLAVLEALPRNDRVRAKIMILLQRMIQCIGTKVLARMPRFLLLLIENCTAEDIQDVAQLLNQLCIKFKEEAIPAIDPALLPFLRKCHQLVPSVGEVTAGNNDIPPHLRTEQLSVQKLAFTVLQHIVSYRVTPVLLSPTNASSLETVLQTMNDGAIHVEDAVMKKACITFFRELVDQWTDAASSSDPIRHGFVRFVLEVFVPGMVRCILDPSFNEKDALQARNVSEFANILFILKTRPGTSDKFEQYVIHGALANVACPPHVLDAFRKVSTLVEMELCLKETVKLLKSTNTS